MQIWHSLDEIPANFGESVVTLGNFDGVHRGHQAVLQGVKDLAHDRGIKAVAVTFDPHPKLVHDPEHQPVLITGLTDKLERLERVGMDGVLVVEYTLEFAHQTPREFVENFLVNGLKAKVVLVGKDTRFGRGNAGDIDTMRDLGRDLGFTVEVIPDACDISPSGRRWSSTWIRELVDSGDIPAANDILGTLHRLRGVVIHGDARGREIASPRRTLRCRAE